jgi:hypothetical protein
MTRFEWWGVFKSTLPLNLTYKSLLPFILKPFINVAMAHRGRCSSRWEYFKSCLVCSTSKTVILRLHVDSYIFWCRENFMLIHKYFDAERMSCWFIHILMQRGFYVDSYMYTTANSLQLAHGRVKSKYLWIFFFFMGLMGISIVGPWLA